MFDIKEWNRNYYQQNKEKKKQNSLDYYQQNKEKINQHQKDKYSIGKDNYEYHRVYRNKNKEKNKEHNNNYYKKHSNDPLFLLSKKIRAGIYQSLKKKRTNKNNKTVDILGCSFEELKKHLEDQFEPWMNWENMGGKKITKEHQGWDIDHIIPLSSAKTEEDIVKLNHYTNLQPLCSYHNRFIKRNK